MKKERLPAAKAIAAAALSCVIAASFASCSRQKKIINIRQENGRLSSIAANYDFVETPDGNEGQPKIPNVELPPAVDYFTNRLDKNTRGVYKQLYNGFLKQKEQIDITDRVIDKDDIGGLLELCTSTSPMVCDISRDYTVSIDKENFVTAITVKYSKTKEQIKKENARLESTADKIIAAYKGKNDEYSKVKYFHDTIIKKCEYSEECENPYSAYGCLFQGKAVCEGYTKAMQTLCDKAGILCLPVVGKGISDNEWQPHMWNKIRIDGKWYAFDLTWDDPVSDFDDDYIRYDYFGLDDVQMNKDHIPDEKKFMKTPEAVSHDADYFVKTGCYFNGKTDGYDFVENVVNSAMIKNENFARIKCSDKKTYQKLIKNIFDDNQNEGNAKFFDILESCVNSVPNNYGYDGYSLVKDDVMFTITVKLKRVN